MNPMQSTATNLRFPRKQGIYWLREYKTSVGKCDGARTLGRYDGSKGGGIILNGIWNEQDVRVCTSCISLGVRSNGWFLWAFWFHKRRGTASNVQSTPHLVSCHVMNLLNLSLIKFQKLWFSFRIVKLVDVLMSPVCPWTLDSQTTDDTTSCFIFNFQHKYN